MSTHEDKVAATYDFLVNRGSQGARLTSHQEVGVVIGELLNQRRQRRISTPVRREKVIKALKAVDDRSVEENGVMLSALVTHFWDDTPGSRFFRSANERGLMPASADPVNFHKSQLAGIAQAYPTLIGVNEVPSRSSSREVCATCGREVEAVQDLSEFEEDYDDEDTDEDADSVF